MNIGLFFFELGVAELIFEHFAKIKSLHKFCLVTIVLGSLSLILSVPSEKRMFLSIFAINIASWVGFKLSN